MSPQLDKVWRVAGRAGSVLKHTAVAHPRIVSGAAAAGLAVGAIAWWAAVRRQPSSEELERRRRERLSTIGRLTDGSIVDAWKQDGEVSYSATADVLQYRYRIGGVTYECAQDVPPLAGGSVGFRIDQPVQVRYDPRNPGNSIIASETWSGLWAVPAGHSAAEHA
jgi:hypothetical protein